MLLVQPPEAVGEFERLGGVIDHLLVRVEPGEFATEAERHRQGALFGMFEWLAREADHFARVLRQSWQRESLELQARFRVDAARCKGERISWTEFLGDASAPGYAYAFLEPPYGLRGGLEPVGFLAQVLGEAGDGLIIYRYTTDWSSYFDIGHEWWGAFCWTVESKGRPGEIWVIAAATTD